jgi:hypothetical protein
MHQGWPKFTRDLWMATPGKGLAALIYAPSEVKAFVGEGRQVTIREETGYPFGETIRFRFTTAGAPISFPFHLRIPGWCDSGFIKLNGRPWRQVKGGKVIAIDRVWRTGDVMELELPMKVTNQTWYENSVSVERGPVTYALKIGEETKRIGNDKDATDYGASYEEIIPMTPWNYGLVMTRQQEKGYMVERREQAAVLPWSSEEPPVVIKARARRIPSWQLYNEMAGPIPYSRTYQLPTDGEEEITLIPYGCTRLRISQFPVVNDR